MSSRKDDEQLSEIASKLDTLIRLSAMGLVKDIKKQRQQIALLSDSGFGPKQIAEILGTSSNTVNVTLNSIRKERTGKMRKEEQGSESVAEVKESAEEATKATTN
jgi:DNA-binding CsgD family transcriptional regulator